MSDDEKRFLMHVANISMVNLRLQIALAYRDGGQLDDKWVRDISAVLKEHKKLTKKWFSLVCKHPKKETRTSAYYQGQQYEYCPDCGWKEDID